MIYQMLGSRLTLLPVLLLLFLLQLAHTATTYPTPIVPDPTYQTGVYTIFSTTLSNSNTYNVPYNYAMSTASLNASLAISGMDYQISSNKNGWQQSIISLNESVLIMQVSVYNKNDPINSMKISYLVSCSQFLDINYVSYTIPTSQAINNFSQMPTPSCWVLDCRNYTATVAYNSKNNGKVLTYLAGYNVNSIGSNSYNYQGISLQPSTANGITTSFSLVVTVFGAIEVSFVSFYYVAFEPSIVNILTYRNIMYGRNYVGCFYSTATCSVSSPLSNSSFTTSSTFVTMNSPYNTQMFFYGFDRVIASTQNPSDSVIFDTPSYGSNKDSIVVNFKFTGNNQNEFHMGFSGFTIQTFYCPPSPAANPYYSYNANTCTDTCNNWVTQYANATRYCQPCGIYCYTCNATATNCTSCYNNQNRVLIAGGTCACDTAGGFYDDGTSVVCPKCNYTCETCSGVGGGACLSCTNTSFRSFNLNSCVCNPGRYDNGAETCSSCHYTCGSGSCNGSNNNNCLTCNTTAHRYILGNFTCGCLSGYYDNSTSSQVCAACLYSCASCWATNTYCTACDNIVMLRTLNTTANTCVCGAGFYDAGVPVCQPCYTTCLTCNGPSKGNCLSCSSTSLRTLSGATCACNSGYYDLNDVCTLCHPYCLTCTAGTQLTCTSCSSANFRTLDSTLSACVCSPGYVQAGVAVCQACSPACLTCTTNSSFCTSCHSLTARYLFNGACLCSASGYIDIYLNGTCSACHYSCGSCSAISNTSCLTCVVNRTLVSGSCVCGSGYYDNGTPTCQPCASVCLNCSNGLTSSCTACNPLHQRYLSGSPAGSCLCSAGYYDSSALLCATCDIKCLTCSSSTTCLTCDFVNNHRTISSGQCVCISGYFDTGAAVCSTCIAPCVSCSNTGTFCTSCNTDRYLSSTNLCLCNPGTFLNASSLCQPCDYTCLTCAGSSTTCLSCYSNSNRNLTANACPCLAGYYDNAVIVCPACYYTCATCTSALVCTLCAANSLRLLQANGSCLCAAGYYDDGSHAVCQTCHPNCLTCSYYSQCLSCNATNFRTWDTLTSSCPCNTGYFDNATPLCAVCHYSCVSCSGSGVGSCLSCQSLRVLNASGFCVCQNSTYEYLNTCTPCAIQCLSCSVMADNCTSCYPGSYLSGGNQCLCSPGYYLNGLTCSACHPTCQTCLTTATACLSCNVSHSTILSGSSCVCPDGFFQNSTSYLCYACNAVCLTCSNSSAFSCLSCDPAAFRTFNSTAFTCLCNPGYYDNNSRVCQVCSSPCLTCSGGSTLNCTSCEAGYTLIASSCRATVTCANYYYSGYCINTCPNTTYPSSGICYPCTNNCLTCLSATVCTSCLSSFYLLKNGSCLGSCPNGTYASNSQCITCPQNCTSCVYRTAVICVTCAATYYLNSNFQCSGNCPTDQTHIIVESRCVGCLSPCATCLNLTSTGCLSCKPGYIMFMGSCLSNCPLNYYLLDGSCQSCPSTCLSCSKGVCDTCIQGYYLSPTQVCTRIGYFLSSGSQVACHPNCKTCTNSSYSSCIACNQYRGDSSSMAVAGYCDCWKNSLDLGNGTCDTVSSVTLQKATQTLVSATTATTYTSVLTGLISMNLMSSFMTVSYQQLYGNFYYVNASAVAQTDKVLEKYSQNSPNTYLNSLRGEKKQQDLFGRRLETEYLQQMESLFMRGSKCEYLFDWAFFTFILICAGWAAVIVLKCLLPRLQNKKDEKPSGGYIILSKINSFLRQSFFIILHLLTINEISFYGSASLKIQLTSSQPLDYVKFSLSIIVLAYYLIYFLRLVIACVGYRGSREEDKRLMVILACFEVTKKKQALSRLYMPFTMLRSILISVFLVTLSFNPFLQTVTCLSVFVVFCLYSLCFCPYRFYIKVFVRLFQLLFTIQLALLTLSVLKPESSRLTPAFALIAINYLQMAGFVGMSLAVLVNHFYGKRCCNKEENIVAPLDPKEETYDVRAHSQKIAEQTLHEIDQQLNPNQIANTYEEEDNKPSFYNRRVPENNISQQNILNNEELSMDLGISQIPSKGMYNESFQQIRRGKYRGRMTPSNAHQDF